MSGLSSPTPLWTTAKCHRTIRPLRSKIQALKSLLERYPSLSQDRRELDNDHISESLGLSNVDSASRRHATKYSSRSHNKWSNGTTSSGIQSSRGGSMSKDPLMKSELTTKKKLIYRLEDLLVNLKERASTEVFISQRSIVHAFNQFLTLSFVSPMTLAQKCAFDIGKCIVHTHGSVSEDDWYDASPVLKFYKRYIVIGHGVSLLAADAEICKDILPCLVLVSIEKDAPEAGLVLLRSLLEINTLEFILDNLGFLLFSCQQLKLSTLILLNYSVHRLSLDVILDPRFLELFYSIVDLNNNGVSICDSNLRDAVRSIFIFCCKESNKTGSRQKVDNVLLKLISALINNDKSSFDLEFCESLVDITVHHKQNRIDLPSTWKYLCLWICHYGKDIPPQFLDHYKATYESPWSGFSFTRNLREAVVTTFSEFEIEIQPIVELLLPKIPRLAVVLSFTYAAKVCTPEVINWSNSVEKKALNLDRDLCSKNWSFDESIGEWVELRSADSPLSLLKNLIVENNEGSEPDENDRGVEESEDDELCRVGIDSSQALSSQQYEFKRDNKRFAKPPSSVVKLTPRSSKRVREKYFKLLSTPGSLTASSKLARHSSKHLWIDSSKASRKENRGYISDGEINAIRDEIYHIDDNDDDYELTSSPLRGRQRFPSGNDRLETKVNVVKRKAADNLDNTIEYYTDVDELSFTSSQNQLQAQSAQQIIFGKRQKHLDSDPIYSKSNGIAEVSSKKQMLFSEDDELFFL
ncbi:hypothetical protein V1511DRAFT_513205 [Dipodascopsis uninucleata]